MKQLLKISIIVLLSAVYAVGQTTGQSRLNIGVNPKVPQVNSKISPLNLTNVPDEVSLNKRDAVINFYKSILLSPKEKPLNPAVSQVSEAFQVQESSENLFANKDLSVRNIYPNPANDRAYVEYDMKNSSTKASVSFHNLLGNTIVTYDLDSFERKIDVLTSNWDDGIYFYQLIVDGKKVATRKLLVRHN